MSSIFVPQPFTTKRTSCSLDSVAKATKLLTVKMDLERLAELGVAADLHMARSVSEHVHQFIVQTIKEARRQVSEVQWQALKKEKMELISQRSVEKSKARKRGLRVVKRAAQTDKAGTQKKDKVS